MEQENIQVTIVEDKKRKRAKIALNVLLVISILVEIYILSCVINANSWFYDTYNRFATIHKSQFSLFSWSIYIIISLTINFIPYFISRRLYKEGKYIQQILFGIATFIIFLACQVVLVYTFQSCTICNSEAYNNYLERENNILPCIPNPAAGINCY